jgi:hypothetical protein
VYSLFFFQEGELQTTQGVLIPKSTQAKPKKHKEEADGPPDVPSRVQIGGTDEIFIPKIGAMPDAGAAGNPPLSARDLTPASPRSPSKAVKADDGLSPKSPRDESPLAPKSPRNVQRGSIAVGGLFSFPFRSKQHRLGFPPSFCPSASLCRAGRPLFLLVYSQKDEMI